MATVIKQLLSRTLFSTDGVTTVWDFSFSGGYIDPSHVRAYTEEASGARTDQVLTLTGPYQATITPALATDLTLVIYRDTPKDYPLVDFIDESGFSEIALDTNAKQAVFIAAETVDVVNTTAIDMAVNAADRADASADAALASELAAAASAADTATLAGNVAANTTSITVVSDNISDVVTVAANIASVNDAASNAASAASSPDAAAADAASAQSSADIAKAAAADADLIIVSGLGFTNSTAYDFGAVSDVVVLFPTDFGTV
jgi:hypothetical protein